MRKFRLLIPPKNFLITILPFVASDGSIWIVLFVYKGKENNDSVMILNNVPIDIRSDMMRGTSMIYYAITDTGFVKDELWNDVFNFFLKI